MQGDKDIRFDAELDDGRVAHCWQSCSQPYSNMIISAGLVEGIEPDDFYLKLHRDGEEPCTLFVRRDELTALIWVASGALWSAEMLSMEGSSA